MATTIAIKQATRVRLEALKTGGQSFDDVISGLLKEREEVEPWLEEGLRRIKEVRTGKVELLSQEDFTAYHQRRLKRGK